MTHEIMFYTVSNSRMVIKYLPYTFTNTFNENLAFENHFDRIQDSKFHRYDLTALPTFLNTCE